jgi:uncharacterized protein
MSRNVMSRYLLIGDQEYVDATGRRVRLAYAARTARLLTLPSQIATALETGAHDTLDEDVTLALKNEHVLVDGDLDERSTVLRALSSNADDRKIRGFTIMPTSYCNMGCSYCGQEHQKGVMRDRLRANMLQRVAAAFADYRTELVRVVWFGGEPLLALGVIREMSGHILGYAQESRKAYSADVVTNGSTLTDRTLMVLEDCGVRWVEVTIDGPEQVHDRRRVKKNGSGSYGRIVDLLSRVIRDGLFPGIAFGIRVNVDRENYGSVDELLEDLARRGIGGPRVQLRLMPVHSWGNDVSAVALEPQDYAQLEMAWLGKAMALGIGFQLLPTEVKRATCVATSRNAEVIDPAGRVYSCTEQPLVPRDRGGTVISTIGQQKDHELRPAGGFDDWYAEVGTGGRTCSRCPLLPVCGGSCPKLWREGAIPCPSFKHNWNERMDLAATRRGLTRA